MANLKIMTFNIATCREPSRGTLMSHVRLNKNNQRLSQCKKWISIHILRVTKSINYPHKLFIPAMKVQGEQYGDAISSKHNFDTAIIAPLDGQNQDEPRSIGIVSFKIGKDQQLFFGVTHLEHAIESLRQAQVKEVIEPYRRMGLENQPFILAGDFNDEPNSRTVQLPCDHCPMTIDHLFMNSKAMKIFQLNSYRTSDKDISSDHLPLIMELKTK